MITFIIGAGAGREVKLPSGYELKKTIANLLDIRFELHEQTSGDITIVDALREISKQLSDNANISPYIEEAWHISKALPQAISIDNFLDAHKDNERLALCGKLSIVRAILQAERDSLLFIENKKSDSIPNFAKLEKTWLIPFFQILTENCTKLDLIKRFQELTIIIFNYDRSVEHFLFYALKN